VIDPSAVSPDPAVELDLIALIVATRTEAPAVPGLSADHATIIRLCQYPQSVAELSARLDLPLSTVRTLLGELLDGGLILVRDTHLATPAPSQHVLKAVINGLRSL
jgi:DNA-binding transcriptional ArsR family regulator